MDTSSILEIFSNVIIKDIPGLYLILFTYKS